METYKITVWYDDDRAWRYVEFEMDFASQENMRHYVERIGQVGAWGSNEDGSVYLIAPPVIRTINVEVLDV